MRQITKELVVASLMPEIVRNNIQQLIDAGKQIKVEKTSLQVNYADLMKIREMHQWLKKRRADDDKPEKENLKARKEAYDTWMKPMEEILDTADPLISKFNAEIRAAEAVIISSIKAQNEIKATYLGFVNDTTRLIANAPDSPELVRIQKLIGTEKSKKNYYGELYPNVEDVCKLLLNLIDERKGIMKANAKIQKEYDVWLAAGDMPKALELKEKMEENNRVITQNADAIAEQAYNQVKTTTEMSADLVTASVRPRTHRWSWEVKDIKTFSRKHPDKVELSPIKKSVTAFMKELTDTDETMSKVDDNEIDGLIIYYKPFYVGINSDADAS